MSLTKFSINNGILVNLLTLLILGVGIYSVSTMNRDVFPNIEFDRVIIQTRYPGATAAQIEKLITLPIEKELKEIDDIKKTNSVSAEGISIINLTLEPDASDKSKIINNIQRAVDRVEDLPSDLEDKPVVQEITTKGDPLAEISIAGEVDPKILRQEVSFLETILLDMKGISSIQRKGYRDPEFSVYVDPEKLKLYHVSLNEVAQVLKKTNVNVPGGRVVEGGKEHLLRVSGEFETQAEIENIVLRSNDAGYSIKIKDVAQVSFGFEENNYPLRTNGREATNLLIIKRSSYDAIRLMDEVKLKLAEYSKRKPAGIHVSVHNDMTYFVKRRLNVLLSNGTYGLIFLLIPLIFFLSKRAALSALFGMAIAFLGTFTLMKMTGLSINLLSMFGLIMVSGMLVDEDLVMAENIQRHLESGKNYQDAVLHGSAEVTRPILATVLTTITAFVPLLMMSDLTGKFVRQIPLIITLALSVSLVEALFILPNHMLELSKWAKGKVVEVKRSRVMSFLDRSYGKYLTAIVNLKKTAVFLSVGAVLLTVFLLVVGSRVIPYVHFPTGGVDRFFVRVELEQGAPVEKTMEKLKEIETLLASLPSTEVEDFVTEGGIVQIHPRDDLTQREPYLGQIMVHLVPEVDRKRSSTEIIQGLREQTDKLTGFKKISFDEVVHNPSRKRPVELKFKGDDLNRLIQASGIGIQELQKLTGVLDVKSDFDIGNQELKAILSQDSLSQAGLTFEDVAMAVRTAMEGNVATHIREGDEDIDVVVRFPETERKKASTLENIFVANAKGNLIPLKSLGAFQTGQIFSAIKHEDRQRVITVSANVDISTTTPIAVNRKMEAELQKIQSQFPGVLVEFGGELEDIQESMGQLTKAFLVALFLIFVIIAATLRSVVQPFMIMFTIPLGVVGIYFAFFSHGLNLNFLAMLGLVGMAGVVVDSAILIVEFFNRQLAKGATFKDALLQGCRLRLRPAILTTLTTVLGTMPTAYGLGGSDPFVRPMALAMSWGLTLGTLFSFLLIPLFLVAQHALFPLGKRLDLQKSP